MRSSSPTQAAIPPTSAKDIRTRFIDLFGGSGEMRIFRAPGRVNLIGEHTDYNDGFVFPAAIGFSTWVAVRTRNDNSIRVHSTNYGETVSFQIDALEPTPTAHWSDYVRGVAGEIRSTGIPVSGADLYVLGEVPLGSGLSSSAAIEVSVALSLLWASGAKLDSVAVAKLCQAAEHHYVGTKCGIMDQLISCVGIHGHAMVIDCRTLAWEPAPIPDEVSIVICNTMVKHQLANGEYNRRRAECESAVRKFRELNPDIKALRDVNLAQLERVRPEMDETVYRRALHVISENERVHKAATALQAGDLQAFGLLMNESHESLRHNYEVSCRELDLIVQIATSVNGVHGARMTGGGFGGCAVALAPNSVAEELVAQVRREYSAQTGIDSAIYICKPVDGAREVTS